MPNAKMKLLSIHHSHANILIISKEIRICTPISFPILQTRQVIKIKKYTFDETLVKRVRYLLVFFVFWFIVSSQHFVRHQGSFIMYSVFSWESKTERRKKKEEK